VEGELWTLRGDSKTPSDQLLWAYPGPEEVGLEFEVDERATVKSVSSFARDAGFEPGDRILRFAGQPIISVADIQWILHHASDITNLGADVDRGGEPARVSLKLPSGWKRAGDYTWRSIAWSLRHRLAGTGPLEKAPSAGPDMALRIKQIPPNWVKDRNLSAARILKAGDIIIAVDGKTDLVREADFLAYLLQKRTPGSDVELTILRAGKKVQASIRLP
jgi:serine protease Do